MYEAESGASHSYCYDYATGRSGAFAPGFSRAVLGQACVFGQTRWIERHETRTAGSMSPFLMTAISVVWVFGMVGAGAGWLQQFVNGRSASMAFYEVAMESRCFAALACTRVGRGSGMMSLDRIGIGAVCLALCATSLSFLNDTISWYSYVRLQRFLSD